MRATKVILNISAKLDNQYTTTAALLTFAHDKLRFGIESNPNKGIRRIKTTNVGNVYATNLGNYHHSNQITPTFQFAQEIELLIHSDTQRDVMKYLETIKPNLTTIGLNNLFLFFDIQIDMIRVKHGEYLC